MSSSSKKQTTFAKMQREQRVRERRAAKAEKKAAARAGATSDSTAPAETAEGELAGTPDAGSAPSS